MASPLVEPNDAKGANSPRPSRGAPDDSSTVSIDTGIKENSRLLRQLASETVRMMLSKDVPLLIKCFLVPLLVILPTLGGELVVLAADCSVHYKSENISFVNYLYFSGAMVILYFIAAFAFAQVSIKFQNVEELREQLTTVTTARRARNPIRSPPHDQYENLC